LLSDKFFVSVGFDSVSTFGAAENHHIAGLDSVPIAGVVFCAAVSGGVTASSVDDALN